MRRGPVDKPIRGYGSFPSTYVLGIETSNTTHMMVLFAILSDRMPVIRKVFRGAIFIDI